MIIYCDFKRVAQRCPRQAFEQYLTSSQQFCHFFRQANGLPQTIQILVGRFSLSTPLGIRFHTLQKFVHLILFCQRT